MDVKNFVLIIYGFWVYGTMQLGYEETLHKKGKAVSHFRAMGDQTHLYIFQYDKLLSKAYVKTAHAVCESTKLFLDMERFHDTLEDKIGRFDSRLHRI